MGYSLLVSPDTSTTLSNQTYRHAIIESVCGFARYVSKLYMEFPPTVRWRCPWETILFILFTVLIYKPITPTASHQHRYPLYNT